MKKLSLKFFLSSKSICFYVVSIALLFLYYINIVVPNVHKIAAFKGDFEALQKCVENNPRFVNEFNENGKSILHVACRDYFDDEIIDYLLEKGANPNLQHVKEPNESIIKPQFIVGKTPLHYACTSSKSRSKNTIIKRLIEAGADPMLKYKVWNHPVYCGATHPIIFGRNPTNVNLEQNIQFTPFVFLVIGNEHLNQSWVDLESVIFFINKGYSKEIEKSLRYGIQYGYNKEANPIINYYIRNQIPGTALKYARYQNEPELLQALIRFWDGDLNQSFVAAIENNHLSAAKVLLEEGADINKDIPLANHPVLYHAINRNDLAMVKFLLAEGADVNIFEQPGRIRIDFHICSDEIKNLIKQHQQTNKKMNNKYF